MHFGDNMSELLVQQKIAKIWVQISRLKVEIEALKDYSESTKFYLENCPLAVHDGESSHYDNSLLLVGRGCVEWNCPFCGKSFTA